MKVLIVDDSEDFIDVVPEFFDDYPEIELIGATSVDEAFSKIDATIDIIITDLNMPECSGNDFMRMAREQGITLPFFALSGHLDHGIVEKLKSEGFAGAFHKPPDTNHIVETIKKLKK